MDGSPPEGRMAAFINHTYDDLTRNLSTPAPYLRSFSADSAYYLFRIRTQDQNIIPTMSEDLDRCFSILVLGAFSTGVFNTNALPRINIGADVWGGSSIMTGVC